MVSHPFHREREMDGARSIHPFSVKMLSKSRLRMTRCADALGSFYFLFLVAGGGQDRCRRDESLQEKSLGHIGADRL